jgi:hypothetical protein
MMEHPTCKGCPLPLKKDLLLHRSAYKEYNATATNIARNLFGALDMQETV